MPLYEMIVVCRIGETQAVANLIKSLVVAIYQEGGVVRRFVNLGDRITQKNLKAKDGSYSSVARYLAVEFDANPETKSMAEKVARANSEALNVFTHKMKEMEYYKVMLNKEVWKQMEVQETQINENNKDQIINVLAKQVNQSTLEDELKSAIQSEIDRSKRL
jgi:hypothetical protein